MTTVGETSLQLATVTVLETITVMEITGGPSATTEAGISDDTSVTTSATSLSAFEVTVVPTLNTSILVSESPSSRPGSQTSLTSELPSSLPTGGKVGIGIGAVVGAVCLMALGAFISCVIRRRRLLNTGKNCVGIFYTPYQPGTSELPGSDIGPVATTAHVEVRELDGTDAETRISKELVSAGRTFLHRISRKELDGTQWKRELEGDIPKVPGFAARS